MITFRSLLPSSVTSPARWAICCLLAIVALFVHGYHPFAEDAAIYIPAIKKQLDPALYPTNSEFFTLPAHFSVFAKSIAKSTQLLHLPVSYVLLFWYLACLTFTITACWRLASLCFRDENAGFAAASLASAIISMPAAGCALLLSDPYLTGRSVSTPLSLFAIVSLLERRYLTTLLLWLLAFAFHPLMAAVTGLFLVLLWAAGKSAWRRYYVGVVLLGIAFFVALAKVGPAPVTDEYRDAVLTRSYFFLSQWTWYELLGAIAPLLLLVWMGFRHRREENVPLFRVSLSAIFLGLLALSAAAAVTWIPSLFPFARLQPMRAYQLIYFLLLLPVIAGLQQLSRTWKPLRMELSLAVLLLCLASGMYAVQRRTFPASAHVEWPWSETRNAWQEAFQWIRDNTPRDAVFALDADYPDESGNDRQGFGATAERSVLPNRSKDGGVAALFPQLAHTWKTDIALTTNINPLNEVMRAELLRAGVTWIVVRTKPDLPLDCPYFNEQVSVCRLQPQGYAARLNSTKQNP